MSARRRLANKRRSYTSNVEHHGNRFRMTVGHYETGEIGEVFLNAERADSAFDAFIGDAAILVSLLLQYGCPILEITHALKRDSQGHAASPIGTALNRIAKPTVAS
jgi:hypothetical protein